MIHELRESLKNDYDVLEFHSDPLNYNPDDLSAIHELYEHDLNCVKSCDFMIAECSCTSTGLGFEIGVAVENDKPILAIAQEGVRVTRMVQGITHPKFSFLRYVDGAQVPGLVRDFVRQVVGG
jgi:nucleoside 2-deoxyribosyltransferase